MLKEDWTSIMTEWTREERYQRIEDVDTEYFKNLKQQVDQSKFRQQFHIQPETGLLNDPNGLIFIMENIMCPISGSR